MKHILLLVAAILIVTACSSPRYTYNFDYYDYNSGRKHHAKVTSSKTEEHPLALEERTLVASAAPIVLTEEDIPVAGTAVKPDKVSRPSRAVLAETKKAEAAAKENAALLAKRYKELSKSQRKEFKAELKKQFKRYMKAKRTGDTVAANNATSNMDQDLKMAIIFGAVGLTLSLFGGINEAFWILGVIAIVVGVVFLVKWLVRQ